MCWFVWNPKKQSRLERCSKVSPHLNINMKVPVPICRRSLQQHWWCLASTLKDLKVIERNWLTPCQTKSNKSRHCGTSVRLCRLCLASPERPLQWHLLEIIPMPVAPRSYYFLEKADAILKKEWKGNYCGLELEDRDYAQTFAAYCYKGKGKDKEDKEEKDLKALPKHLSIIITVKNSRRALGDKGSNLRFLKHKFDLAFGCLAPDLVIFWQVILLISFLLRRYHVDPNFRLWDWPRLSKALKKTFCPSLFKDVNPRWSEKARAKAAASIFFIGIRVWPDMGQSKFYLERNSQWISSGKHLVRVVCSQHLKVLWSSRQRIFQWSHFKDPLFAFGQESLESWTPTPKMKVTKRPSDHHLFCVLSPLRHCWNSCRALRVQFRFPGFEFWNGKSLEDYLHYSWPGTWVSVTFHH